MRKLLALLLTVVTSLPGPAFAQDDPWDTIQTLRPGTQVLLMLTTRQAVSGTLLEIESDAVVLAIDPRSAPVSLPASATRSDGGKTIARALVSAVRVKSPLGTGRYKLRNGGQPEAAAVKVVAAALGVGRKVDVRTVNGEKFRTRIAALDEDGMTVAKRARTIPYADVTELKPAGLHWGAKTGIVIGALYGVLGLWWLHALGTI